MELTALPGVFAVRWIADRWLLIAPDPHGPHGGWVQLPLFLPEMASGAVRRHEG
jgi:hypothetical protein